MTSVPGEAGDVLTYDPYDFDIDTDPYPVWKRLRDEAPLYYNEPYAFFALSRHDDVERSAEIECPNRPCEWPIPGFGPRPGRETQRFSQARTRSQAGQRHL